MAIPRICSIEGCGNGGGLHRGWCSKHYGRWQRHGDPNYVVPKELRDYSNHRGPKKFFVSEDWLRNEYITKRRRNDDLCKEIGCSPPTLLSLLARAGIEPRDDRNGVIHLSRRVAFDLKKATNLYLDHEWNCDRIGGLLGVNGCTIRRRLRESGVKIRHQNDTKRGRPSGRRIELDQDLVAAEYAKEGATVRTLNAVFGVTDEIIRRTLASAGIEIKKRDRDGAKNPNWRPDLTADERAARRDSAKQAKWRVLVYERDGYACQRCGDDKGGNLNAHHIEAHCENFKDRNNLDNGVTLCIECHRQFHRVYGLRDFGRPELAEFLLPAAKSRVG